MRLFAIGVFAILGATVSAWAAENAALVGTWQVTSFTQQLVDNNEIVRPFEDRVGGYLQYGPGGHMVVFLVGGERNPPAASTMTEAERAALFNGIFGAYAGTYHVDGNKLVHHVVASWNQAWTGTDQVRYFELNGKNLTIKSAPDVILRYGITGVNILTFEKLE